LSNDTKHQLLKYDRQRLIFIILLGRKLFFAVVSRQKSSEEEKAVLAAIVHELRLLAHESH
jgi:hypothetical protein